MQHPEDSESAATDCTLAAASSLPVIDEETITSGISLPLSSVVDNSGASTLQNEGKIRRVVIEGPATTAHVGNEHHARADVHFSSSVEDTIATLTNQSLQVQELQQEGAKEGDEREYQPPGDETIGDNEDDEKEEMEENGSGDGEEQEDSEEQEEVEEEEKGGDDYGFEPPVMGSGGPASTRDVFIIQGKKYTSSAIIHNAGFIAAQRKLRGNPKATFAICPLLRTHNVTKCHQLHLTNRAVLIGDCYVRINMLEDNPARQKLLTNPATMGQTGFCSVVDPTHDASTCSAFHLLPGIVFVGRPELKVGYFEGELHENVALRRLKGEVNTCGRWCKNRRSHVVVTCGFVHYNRGSTYTEVPREPSKPLALIPNMRPRAPRISSGGGNSRNNKPQSRGRGRGGKRNTGRGAHKGNFTAGGRGGGGSSQKFGSAVPVPECMDHGSSTPFLQPSIPVSEEKVHEEKERFLNIIIVLLGIMVATLAYFLHL